MVENAKTGIPSLPHIAPDDGNGLIYAKDFTMSIPNPFRGKTTLLCL